MRFSTWIFISLLAILQSGCLGNSNVSTGLKVANYAVGRVMLSNNEGVTNEMFEKLQRGELSDVREQLEARDLNALTPAQLRLLCDIYGKFNDIKQTFSCLSNMESRFQNDAESINAINGRRALLYFQLGDYKKAHKTSKNIESAGGIYIHALSGIFLEKKENARQVAARFSQSSEPKELFFSTALYSSLEDYKSALKILNHPKTRLLKDYGLLPFTGVFGEKINPAIFQLDLFNEFNFGFFKAFSFAPKANIYIEFMAAKAYAKLNDKNEALKRLNYLISNLGVGAFRDVLWVSYLERGKLFEDEARYKEAISDYGKALELIEGIRSTIHSETGRVGFVFDKFEVYNRSIDLLIKLGKKQEALELVERSKGRVLVDLLSSRQFFGTAKTPSSNMTSQLLKELSETEVNLLNGSGDSDAEAKGRGLKISAVHQRIKKQAPKLEELISVKPMPFNRIANLPESGESILIYHYSSNLIHSFCLNKNGMETSSIDARGLFEQIDSFRNQMKNEDDSYQDQSKALYQKLIKPLAGCLSNEKLTIIPSGPLYYLPFSALMDKNDTYLIEKSALRVFTNLSAMELLHKNRPENNKFLIIGNPQLSDDALSLPGAESEAIAIADMTEGETLLLEESATAEAFLELAKDYGYIHIASHGVFNSEAPLDSRLLLSPTTARSGDITVNDLYEMELSAHMVVLSACETALSHISPGDELFGLQRGFFFAGTNGLLGSLWEISDESTEKMMVDLYKYLKNGLGPSASLRLSQLDLIKNYPHPHYWAPFQYTGVN